MLKKTSSWLRNALLMALLTLAAFFIMNLVAYLVFSLIRDKGAGLNERKYFVAPLSPEGQAILHRNLPEEDAQQALRLLASDPGFRPHPVLGYTEGGSTPGYRIGIESIRYQEGWSDLEVAGWLAEANLHTYVLGGSTAFGHGVGGNHTLAAELNRILPGKMHLNFGIQAYDSQREVDLLLHLLRKGYRPARVLFIDGLNDLTTMSWSGYPPLEKPRTQSLLEDRGEVALIFGYPRHNNMLRALAFSLPVVQLIRYWQWQLRFQNFQFQRRRADRDPLDWQELVFYYTRWTSFQPHRAGELAEEWIDYYAKSIQFVKQLGHEFGFEAEFVLQPIGPAEPENPFVLPAYRGSAMLSLYSTFLESARQAIREGRLPALDCSAVLDSTIAQSYVDLSHYSPQGNRLLAECIKTLR